MAEKPATIDDYLAAQPAAAQAALTELRNRIHRLVPEAQETIRYDIPTFALGGRSFVHLAAWKQHISLYPIPSGDAAFEQDIEPYRAGKGTLQFRLGQPLPYQLIDRVVELLAAQRT
jgi:uncharacterized protein YdhG (YjbR/CyaY superfamily)